MIFGLLLVIIILYGLLLFWVLNERLKDMGALLKRTNENTRRMEEKMNLLLGLVEEENGKDRSGQEGNGVRETFTAESFESEGSSPDITEKGGKQ